MRQQYIFCSIIVLVVLIVSAGGWYVYKFRTCLDKISYTPLREQKDTGGGFSGLEPIENKGDYYTGLYLQRFRDYDEAMRTCIWR